jgi:DNA-binding transcriptional regulator GbsR (MarR family)
MLKSTNLTQSEICSIVGKSPPSISRTLKSLIQRNIVETLYNSPGKTYSLKNKFLLISWMKDTHPDLINSMTDNVVEMFP